MRTLFIALVTLMTVSLANADKVVRIETLAKKIGVSAPIAVKAPAKGKLYITTGRGGSLSRSMGGATGAFAHFSPAKSTKGRDYFLVDQGRYFAPEQNFTFQVNP